MIAFPTFAISLYTKAKSNLAQIVTGIEKAKTQLPPASTAILEANLSSKMDASVKAQVKQIKGDLVANGTIPTTPVVITIPVSSTATQ